MSSSITKVAVICTGVIGTGWIIRAIAHNKKVNSYDKDFLRKLYNTVNIFRAVAF